MIGSPIIAASNLSLPGTSKMDLSITKKLTVLLCIGFLLELALNAVLAQLLTPTHFGDFRVVFSIITAFSPLVVLGAESSVGRFVPEYLKNQRLTKLKGFLTFKGLLFVAAFLVCLVCTLAYLQWIRDQPLSDLTSDRHHPMWAFLWLIPLLASNKFLERLLRSFNLVSLAFIPYIIIFPLTLMSLLHLNHGFVGFIDIHHALFALGASFTIVALIQLVILFAYMPKTLPQETAAYEMSTWLRAGVTLLGVTFSTRLFFGIELLLLEMLSLEEVAIGYFAALIMIVSVNWVIYNATTMAYLPEISPTLLSKDKQAIRQLLLRGFKTMTILSACAALLIIVFAPQILHFFGPTYVAYSLQLRVLAIGCMITNILSVPRAFLQYSHFAQHLVVPSVAIIFIAIVISSVFILWLGLWGAVLSFILNRFVQSLWLNMLCRKLVS